MKTIYTTIVLIADRTYQEYEDHDPEGRNLEKIPDSYFNEVRNGLLRFCQNVVHYNSPKELIENACKHTKDLVFTIYGGEKSRNRMALVPAVCEAYGIKYVGADVYARIVCQDKQLTKEWVKNFDINVPESIVLRHISQKKLISNLRLPLVIKPLMEGSSIGINDNSFAKTYEQAKSRFEYLLKELAQPILVEEFIPGKELSCCICGSEDRIEIVEIIEVAVSGNSNYFDNNLYTAKTKLDPELDIELRLINKGRHIPLIKAFEKLFKALGKVDYMRIDGKLNNGCFTLIELTPDAYLGKDSSFSKAFISNDQSYSEMLQTIVNKALSYYRTPYSSE